MNHESNSNNYKKIIFGNKHQTSNDNIFVNEYTFDSPLWKQLTYAPEILKKIQNSTFTDIPFLELFQYNNFSLYWFFYPYVYAEIKNTANLINELTSLIHSSKISQLHVEENFKNLNSFHDLCKKENLSFSFSKNNFMKYKLSKNLKSKIRGNRLKKITELKIKQRTDLFFNKNQKIPDFSDKIIIASPEIFHRSIVNSKIQKIEHGEFALHEIINFLGTSHDFVGLSLDYEIRSNLETLTRRLDSEIPWLPIEALLKNPNPNHYSNFINEFQNLTRNKNFHEIFSFNDINLWESFERVFTQMTFSPYISFWLNLYDSLDVLFQNSKPKAVFLTYETGPIALAIINACKKNGIKTISMQHGIIAKNWKYYTVNPLETQSRFGFPIPDKMLLYGNFSKNILLENHFPQDRLEVFGNPEFFNLQLKKKILTQSNLRKKYGIKHNQKIILFTPIVLEKEYDESEKKLDYNLRIWEHLLQNFKNDPNFHIFLKPHPGENHNSYEKILENVNCNNANIIFDNILEIISISDIVITMFSSIIVDALSLDKYVLEINYPNVIDPIEFNKMGKIMQSNIENITSNVKQIFDDSKNTNSILQDSQKIIKEIYGIPEQNPLKILTDFFNP